MPFSMFERYAGEQLKFEARQMADLITATAIGSRAEGKEVDKQAALLRAESEAEPES